MAAELVYPAKNIVGESLIWDEIEQRLLWIDIVGKSIHAFTPETEYHQQWETPDFVTSIGLRKDGGQSSRSQRQFAFGTSVTNSNFWPKSNLNARAIA